MSRSKILAAIVVAFLCVFGMAFVASANGGPTGRYTGVQVQNLGSGDANVMIEYYTPDGTLVSAATRSYTIPVGSSMFILASQNADLPLDFKGSAVLSSSEPIAAIVNASDYAGGGYAHSAASHEGFDSGATTYYLPLLYKNFSAGWNTRFYVQNVTTSTAHVTIYFYRDDGTLEYVNDSAVSSPIPPYASREYVQETDPNITTPFRGSAIVASDHPVAAVVEEYLGTTMLLGYDGVPAGDLTNDLRLPHLWKGYSAGWYSNFTIQNAHSDPLANPATVYVNYSNGYSYSTIITTTQQILQINEPEGSLPTGWIGAATITSTNPLVGIVNHARVGSKYISSYTAYPAATASTEVRLPLVWNNYSAGWYSSVSVQVMASTFVTITYTGGTPPLPSAIQTVEWVETSAFFLQSTSGVPNGWIGSATITADQPVLAIVNEQLYPALLTRDVLLTYRPFH